MTIVSACQKRLRLQSLTNTTCKALGVGPASYGDSPGITHRNVPMFASDPVRRLLIVHGLGQQDIHVSCFQSFSCRCILCHRDFCSIAWPTLSIMPAIFRLGDLLFLATDWHCKCSINPLSNRSMAISGLSYIYIYLNIWPYMAYM